MAAGIETVYQTLAVCPALDIGTNLFLGRERRKPGILGSVFRMLDLGGMREAARKEMSELGLLTIQDMSQAVETLSGGQRQGVAVARAAAFGQRVDHHGRAHRGARREGIRQGAPAHPGRPRPRHPGHPHQPQHAARLRGRRTASTSIVSAGASPW